MSIRALPGRARSPANRVRDRRPVRAGSCSRRRRPRDRDLCRGAAGARGAAAGVAAAPAWRCWPDGRSCWPSWMPGCRPVTSPGPRIVVLYGLGGAGKTSVAVEYAYRHLAEVGLAWQFAAEDPAVLAAGFGELAAQLGVRDLVDAAGPGGLGARGACPYPAGWLLVFDNAPDLASVRPFLPPAGPGPGADHQPEPELASPARPWRCRCSARRSPRISWSTAPATRTGRQLQGAGRGTGRAAAGAGAGRRLHAGHRGQPGRVPGIVPAAARGHAGPRRADRVRQDSGHHLVAGVRAAGAVRARRRSDCCGCWRSAHPRRSRCACCCSPAPNSPNGSARRWRRCWRRCWRTSWQPGTRSRRCAGIRWSPRPGTGWCRCTGWCRPSPPIRCPPSWPGSGGRPPPP